MKLSTTLCSQAHQKNTHTLSLLDAAYARGFMQQSSAGYWQLDHFGAKLKEHICHTLKKTMYQLGCSQIELSSLQDGNLWETTGRHHVYGNELFGLNDRNQNRRYLAATAEEAACQMVKRNQQTSGCRDTWGFQIGTKWRDEIRARGGFARAREFSMLDAYSFSKDETTISRWHQETLVTFEEYLRNLGLHVKILEADCGEIGGLRSHEIVCISKELGDQDGHLELAHLFELGTKYTHAFDIRAQDGSDVYMGCQGLGVSRLMMALLEDRRSHTGFWGDEHACAYLFWICSLDSDEQIQNAVNDLRRAAGQDAVWDDRDIQAGRKLMESESCMSAWRLVVSKRHLAAGNIEWKNGKGDTTMLLSMAESKSKIDHIRRTHWL